MFIVSSLVSVCTYVLGLNEDFTGYLDATLTNTLLIGFFEYGIAKPTVIYLRSRSWCGCTQNFNMIVMLYNTRQHYKSGSLPRNIRKEHKQRRNMAVQGWGDQTNRERVGKDCLRMRKGDLWYVVSHDHIYLIHINR